MRIPIVYSVDRWYSSQPTESRSTSKLQPGDIVIADRKPFRVREIREVPTDRWKDKFVEAWREAGMPDAETWWSRPLDISGSWDVEDPGVGPRYGVQASAGHMWSVLPEHYSVCRLCNELPPCRHVHNERVMEHAAERMAETMSILPGCCHGCGEPITARQKSFTFPGANLIRPDLGDNSAIFHTRVSCFDSIPSYDRKWAAAEPGRRRFFYCEGTRVWHHDGTFECDRDDCVGKGDMAKLVDHRMQVWHHPEHGRSGCRCLEKP